MAIFDQFRGQGPWNWYSWGATGPAERGQKSGRLTSKIEILR